jgi:hypothetical protein
MKTLSERYLSETTLAADNKEQMNMWWDGLQQHLLDQGKILKPQASDPCWFELSQGLCILVCKEAVQIDLGRYMVLLRC